VSHILASIYVLRVKCITVKNPKENTTPLLNYCYQLAEPFQKKKKRERCIISGLIWWSAAGARPPRAIKRTP